MQYIDLTTIELIKDPVHWQRQHQKAVELKNQLKAKLAQVRKQSPVKNEVAQVEESELRKRALQMAAMASGRGVTL